jgi:ABC-2 type transport system ATP-binding protein
VGLGEVRYRKVSTYSLGMKQLIKLAQALAHGPRLLILDEPTNGLDPVARQRMIQLIKDIRKEGSIRLLISSHLLRDIDETCDEVLILKKGRIASLRNIEEERRSNRSFMETGDRGRHRAFCVSMRGLGCECASFPGGRIKLVMPDSIEVRDLYVIASEQGVQIRRMNHRRRDSLEDIFLRAMDNEPEGGNLAVYKRSYSRLYRARDAAVVARRVLARYAFAEAWSSKITIGSFHLQPAALHRLVVRNLSRQ